MVLRDVSQIETVHEIIGCGQNYRSHKHVSRTTFAPHLFAPKSPSIFGFMLEGPKYTHTHTHPAPKKGMTSQNKFWTFQVFHEEKTWKDPKCQTDTLPKTNKAPENRPSQGDQFFKGKTHWDLGSVLYIYIYNYIPRTQMTHIFGKFDP